jgi:hypothetical protein
VQAPGKPSMAMRRKAMMAKPAMGMKTPSGPAMPAGNPALPAMKKGGKMAEGGKSDIAQDKAMIKKAFKQHDMQEHKGGKGTDLKLKKGGKYATGGVTNGQGGFAKGGIISEETSASGSGPYRNTLMHGTKPDNSPAKTGGVKNGNGGGFATGGVTKSNGGGYRKGGATKKFADGGKVQSDGGPEKMPQGRKPASQPVEINALSGTFKNGGKVAPGNKASQAFMNKINAPAMREAKAKSVEAYAPMGSVVRKNKGGMPC